MIDITSLVFTQDKIDIPETWSLTTLREKVPDIEYGLSEAIPKTPPEQGVKIVSTADITKNDQILYNKIRYIDVKNKNYNRILLKDGDLLFNWRNSAELIGKCGIFQSQTEDHIFASFILRLRCDNRIVSNQFLKYLFRYYRENSIFIKLSRRAVNQANYNKNEISELRIPFPPLLEQQKIGAVLSTVQRAIELQNELIERTTELKKSMMHKLFTEGVRGERQKETEIGMVPESWEVVPLGKYAMIKNGYAFKSKDYVKNGILSVRISNVSHGILIDKDNKYLPESYLTKYSDYTLKEGDLIISLTRPIISTGMKYCFIEKNQLPLLLNQRVGKFEVKDETRITRDYLYYIVFSSYFIKELKKLFGSSSQQPNVSPVQLEKFLIPLPSLDEQKEIFKILHSINQKIYNHINKKEKLEELFKTLLHQLMTAQVRVDGLDLDSLSMFI